MFGGLDDVGRGCAIGTAIGPYVCCIFSNAIDFMKTNDFTRAKSVMEIEFMINFEFIFIWVQMNCRFKSRQRMNSRNRRQSPKAQRQIQGRPPKEAATNNTITAVVVRAENKRCRYDVVVDRYYYSYSGGNITTTSTEVDAPLLGGVDTTSSAARCAPRTVSCSI